MKKNILLKITLLLIAAVLLASCGNKSSESSKDGEVYEFDFNIQIPATHKFHTEAVKPWADLVEEKTNGKVKINIYNSGALGTLATAYEDIKGGLYDIGYVNPAMHVDTDLYPLTIGDLPFSLSNPSDKEAVLGEFQKKYMSEGFDETELLAITSTDSYQLYSKEPVESIEDVKNQKVIAQGAERIDLVKAWGAVPVSLGLEQIYESLEKNTVDQATYTSVGAIGLKLFEVTSYLTKVDMGSATLVFLMNEDKFEQLPDDLHKLFEDELGPKLGELTGKVYSSQAEESFKEFEEKVKSKDGGVITLSDEELQKFREPSKKVWDDWVKETNKKGYDGEEMMAEFKEMLSNQGIDVPFK